MKSDQTDPCYNPLKYPQNYPQQVKFSNPNSKESIKHSSPKLLFFSLYNTQNIYVISIQNLSNPANGKSSPDSFEAFPIPLMFQHIIFIDN